MLADANPCMVTRRERACATRSTAEGAPTMSAWLLSFVPLLCFGFLGVGFIAQNYACVMGVIELYAMGATFLISLVKWLDWLWE